MLETWQERGRVDGVLPAGVPQLPPRPSRNRTSGFPTYGSSAFIQVRPPKWIEVVSDPHRGPPDPRQCILESRPRVAASLTLSVEPFIHQPFYLLPVLVASPSVIRDGVVVEIPFQLHFGYSQQFPLLQVAPLLPQPFVPPFQFCSQLLLRRHPLPLVLPMSSRVSVVGEYQKLKLLWFLPTLSTSLLGESSEFQKFRLAWLYLQAELL